MPCNCSMTGLPLELQARIFRLLDPISLIAVAQTCASLRRIIAPSKKHFVERLLALERLPPHGGPLLVYNPENHQVTPGWDDVEAARTMRWACTDCLKLYPHGRFDTHYLIGLQYRKPPSFSASPITSWELTRREEYRLARLSPPTIDKEHKRMYAWFVETQWSTNRYNPRSEMLEELLLKGIAPFAGESAMELSEFEKLENCAINSMLLDSALHVEDTYGNRKRHTRRCLECQYERRLTMRWDNNWGGTQKFPVVRSRQVTFATELERWFPGISTVLKNADLSHTMHVAVIYNDNRVNAVWTTSMARCPRCIKWQEIREFRCAVMWKYWVPRFDIAYRYPCKEYVEWELGIDPTTRQQADAMICNHCYAKEHGQRSLGEVLSRGIRLLLQRRCHKLEEILSDGWQSLEATLSYGTCRNAEWKGRIEKLIEEVHVVFQPFEDIEVDETPGRLHIELLRVCFEKFKTFWQQLEAQDMVPMDDALGDFKTLPLRSWTNKYDALEAYWYSTTAALEELEGKAHEVGGWALGRDGASLR